MVCVYLFVFGRGVCNLLGKGVFRQSARSKNTVPHSLQCDTISLCYCDTWFSLHHPALDVCSVDNVVI